MSMSPSSVTPTSARAALASWLRETLAAIRGVPADQLRDDVRLRDQGIESSMSLKLVAKLSEKLGRPIPVTEVWRHGTINGLAKALSTEAEGSSAPRAGAAPGRAQNIAPVADDPIA